MDQPAGARGRTRRPQGVDEEIGGDRFVRTQEQREEQRPVLGGAEGHGDAAGDHLDGAEDAELDAGLGRD